MGGWPALQHLRLCTTPRHNGANMPSPTTQNSITPPGTAMGSHPRDCAARSHTAGTATTTGACWQDAHSP